MILVGLLLFFKPEILLRLKYGRYTKEFPRSAVIVQKILGILFIAGGIRNVIVLISLYMNYHK